MNESRWTFRLLAGFSFLTALTFHRNFDVYR